MTTGPQGLRYWLLLGLTLGLAALLLAAACATAYIIVNPPPAEQYTELYLMGAEDRAEGYPAAMVIGENATIVACVRNCENAGQAYDLAVRYDNGTMAKTVYTEHIDLPDNATWKRAFRLEPDIPGDAVKIAFALYRDGEMSSPYRECHLWVNVSVPYGYHQP